MTYLELLLGFFEVGCFAFGGAYGAIPLIRDVVLRYGWLTQEEITYLIAVSESTPGPIMVNMATYVGSKQGGFTGALIATMGVILPSFIIILLLTVILKTALKNKKVSSFLEGITPCIIGIVFATGITMVSENCIGSIGTVSIDSGALLLTFILGGISVFYPKVKKKKMSPISLIVIAAVLGIVMYS